MATADSTRVGRLPRVLGPIQALCVVVGSVIGSGIFIVPAKVAREIGAIGPIVLLWVVAGVFSLAGALTLAELGAMLPSAGGPYVYLREAYGRLPAFLFGWTEFLVIRAGSIATIATGFAIYFATLVPPPGGLDLRIWQAVAACSAVAAVAAVNVVGTRHGGWVQVVGTTAKVGALLAMMVLPFVLGKAHAANLSPMWSSPAGRSMFDAMLAAVVSILWAYDGWANTSSMAEEIRDPGRSIPGAMFSGMLGLIAIYVGMTVIYHLVLPMGEIAGAATEKGSPRIVAADFFRSLIGPPGLVAIALVVMTSTIISLNGNALSGPRAYFAMARDGLFPAGLCRVHPRFETPYVAVIAQAAWSILLIAASTAFLLIEPPKSGAIPEGVREALAKLHETPLFEVMSNYVIFGATVIYTMTVTAVFTLRVRRPEAPRPYRVWGYPFTPILYLAASAILLWSMIVRTPSESFTGLGIILLGLPAFFLFSASGRPAPIDGA